jgi:long-chain acyl-CoA synthetase
VSAHQTIPELFFNRVSASGDQTALLAKTKGQWHSRSWTELADDVRALASGIHEWVVPGDNVCILSENRPEWWVSDLAILSLGAASTPIYPTSAPKAIAHIINDCRAALLFVSSSEQLAKVQALHASGELPHLQRIIVFDDIQIDDEQTFTLTEVCARGTARGDVVDERITHIGSDDVATLIYTSGTTGEPKGVMLTHGNIVANVEGAHSIVDQIELPDERLMLSFLPLSHSFERTVGYYGAVALGFKVAFAESIDKLADNLAEVRPTLLVSVPRIYEKVYARVWATADTPRKQKILKWAIEVGKKYARLEIAGASVPAPLRLSYAIASRLVFAKMRARLGGRLRYAISGGAPLAVEVAEFLNAVGLRVFEGYGLSETSPILAANRPGHVKIGSVGLPWPGVEITIAADPERENQGEILARGPSIMKGYYNKPKSTAEVLCDDGWFRTGDIGFIDDDGFLFITDRKKELLKTSGGKYVAPQPIENALKSDRLVEQAVLIGDRRKYCVALLVPDFTALKHTVRKELPADQATLNQDPQIAEHYHKVIERINRDLSSWEQIKRFYLLSRELSEEAGELTPTLKLKRRVIENKYAAAIDTLY